MNNIVQKNQELMIALECVNTPFNELKGKSRRADIVIDRHIVMFLLSVHSDYIHTRTGNIFNRCRSAVVHSIKSLLGKAKYDSKLKARIDKTVETYKSKTKNIYPKVDVSEEIKQKIIQIIQEETDISLTSCHCEERSDVAI
jgi:hypothetical protein